MNLIRSIYRRLDRIQHTRWFHLVASIVVFAMCAWVFGSLLSTTYSLDAQHRQIVKALEGQNLQAGDEHAVSLREGGAIELNGKRYANPNLKNYVLFDSQGNIVSPSGIADELLASQRPAWAPKWMLEQPQTTWLLAGIITAWLLLIVWMNISLPFVLTVLGTAVPVAICWWLDRPAGMLTFGGIGLLVFTFVLLTRTCLLVMHQPFQVLAVAHTVVKEASRTRLSLVFIILLLVLLPMLPMWLDPESPLRYQIQTFISRSLSLTFAVAACMTLFLSCASVAFEIRDRQIWQLMTKPLGRLQYLLGKWLGVAVVNLIILAVAGVSTFVYIQYLRERPVAPNEAGQLDALAVRDEVLTARVAGRPVYPMPSAEQLRNLVDQRIANDPELTTLEEVPLSTRRRLEREILTEHGNRLRSIPPWDDPRYDPPSAVYTFTGLQHAKRLRSTLTLKYRFHILRDDTHETYRAAFVFNDDPATQRLSTYVPTLTHSFPIGNDLIRDDGTLTVRVFNLYQPPPDQRGIGSLNFELEDFELLYKAGNFEANFVRAMLTMWTKLAFLAALGVCCATFLSFPVACLLSFTVFIGGMLGPYLAESLNWYGPPPVSMVDWSNVGMVLMWAFEWTTTQIAKLIVFMLGSFGEYRPTQNLVEGKLIRWSTVFGGFLRLGLLWSGLAMIVGYLVMRNRQLAIYSGQG